jgi:hypothetical protein
MSHLFFGPDGCPLNEPKDVICYLGKGKEHWKEDRSAYQTAHSWFTAKGLPPRIRDLLVRDRAFQGAVLQKGIFEKKTKLDSYGRESQTDVLAYLKTDKEIVVLGIEAKVDEGFGPLVREWNDYGTGKLRRLVGLLDRLQIKSTQIGALRYQLFHRTAATLIEAREAAAPVAAMIVQSFDDKRTSFDDFVAFADAFGTPITAPNQLSRPKKLGDVTMRLGWADNPMYRAKT